MPAAFYTGADFDRESVFNGINMIMNLYRKPKSKKQLGFITLHTDGSGSYWYTSGSNFLASLEESLSSLEVIADELTDKSSQKQIGRMYRKLNEMMNI